MKKSTTNFIDYNNYKKDLHKKILEELETTGYLIIKNYGILNNDLDKTKSNFLNLNKLIGTPIGHDANNKLIWDIKSNQTSKSLIKTYSEHSHEAELHTDSQYSEYPEDYFSLLTLKKADCGGGALKNGESLERILRETQFPFIVPNVFKKNKLKEYEFNYGPILRENEIRFRIDTFEKAINLKTNTCSKDQLNAFKKLKKLVLNNKNTVRFFLEDNDLIFINNKTTLHGREMFTDKKRHLLRVRMNKHLN